MTAVAVERFSAQPATVTAQYETLRRAAFGAALLPEARSGLILFLRRGMWGWTRTLAAASTPQEPTAATSSGLTEPRIQSPVVHVFAAMAMYPKERRAP